jgi:hypothetical protein
MDDPEAKPYFAARPDDIMNMYTLMLGAAAQGKKENARVAEEAAAEAEARAATIAAVAERTHLAGRETLIDRPAFHLVAEDLNYTQTEGGGEFTLDTMHLWIDSERYVPLKMTMEGVANADGEKRQMRVERENTAFRAVEGEDCESLYEPQRVVMRVAGVLSAKEQKQMEEAEQQLEQMEAQLANMPQAQRDFIVRQT